MIDRAADVDERMKRRRRRMLEQKSQSTGLHRFENFLPDNHPHRQLHPIDLIWLRQWRRISHRSLTLSDLRRNDGECDAHVQR